MSVFELAVKANTNPSGVELATLGLEEAEGSPNANTNPSGIELPTLPPEDGVSNELTKARTKPSGLELPMEPPELNELELGYVMVVLVTPLSMPQKGLSFRFRDLTMFER